MFVYGTVRPGLSSDKASYVWEGRMPGDISLEADFRSTSPVIPLDREKGSDSRCPKSAMSVSEPSEVVNTDKDVTGPKTTPQAGHSNDNLIPRTRVEVDSPTASCCSNSEVNRIIETTDKQVSISSLSSPITPEVEREGEEISPPVEN